MVVTIELPEQIGKELLKLSDREGFVSSAVSRALEDRKAAGNPSRPPKTRPGRRLAASEIRDLALPQPKNRDRELAWRRANQEMLQSRFTGQWVILEGEEIIAHSADAAQAVAEARARGIVTPFVFFVEGLRPEVVRLGL